MDLHTLEKSPAQDGYLFSRGQAWFAFAMTLALMVFDYVDRQVIVSGKPAGCAGSDHWWNQGLRASVNTVPSWLGATWYGPVPGSGESSSPAGVPGGVGTTNSVSL